MPQQDKAVVRHHGALGDFFLLWPALRALAKHPWPGGLYWAGDPNRLAWLSPLGYRRCPPEILRALDGLFGPQAEAHVRNLARIGVFWPVLDKAPPLCDTSAVRFLHGLAPCGPRPCDPAHVRQCYLGELEALGFAADGDWLMEFRRLFANTRRPGKTALLFPGAGHAGKQWPLVQFFQLAPMLVRRGLSPLFVLGPAELERGLNPAPWPAAAPSDDQQLARLLSSARFVVGGDCGPMHLAGMLGVPGVSLFGPTSFAQWGQAGMTVVRAGLACSPCTRTCANLECADTRCMAAIGAAQVAEALENLGG